MPRMARDLAMTSASFALPIFDRCERPRAASLRISGVQPGRLAQGPEEKNGRNGRVSGRFICRPFQNESAPVGERGPPQIMLIFVALSTEPVTWGCRFPVNSGRPRLDGRGENRL